MEIINKRLEVNLCRWVKNAKRAIMVSLNEIVKVFGTNVHIAPTYSPTCASSYV
jgi:hypothetical protein